MPLLPVFPIRLLMLVLPVVIAVVVLMVATATDQRQKMFGRQGVAWFLTSLMIVAAIGIGYGKAHASNVAEPAPDLQQGSSPALETIPPGFQQGPGTFPSYVRDDAGVLSDAAERELYERNLRLYERYDTVIGVITCNDKYDLGSYALNYAKDIGLGSDNFIVVLDIRGEDYLLIGVEGYFTDEDCSRYAWDYMEEAFAAGDYDTAVLKLTQALEDWYGRYFR